MKRNIAIIFALIADGVQILLTPLIPAAGFGLIVDGVIDLGMAVFMIVLLGPHWAFLPAFIVELIPGIGIVPLWTLAVLYVSRTAETPSRRNAKPVEHVGDAAHSPAVRFDQALDEKGRPIR